ncbi:MAG: 4Fe-4S binding protein [Burkholderiales bacterium]|nr:4Fe-4S binding protein [Burkholderiales bacterium]
MAGKPRSLREHVERVITDTLDRCTACGRCYQVCPMPRYSALLQDAPGERVVGEVLQLLRREPGRALGLEFVKICTQSASCIPACPEGIDPMLMLRVARMVALGALGEAPQMEGREEPQFFQKIDTYAALQLDERELLDWHDRRLP